MTTPSLATIGYEMATLDQLIARLQAAKVELVVDVRAVASSRRPGFSKTMLGVSLQAAGIGYRHLRALGTPKAGREAARSGRTAEMQRIYRDYLEEPAAQVELAEVTRLAAHTPLALLCYEAEAPKCHRAIIAQHICDSLGCERLDL